MMLNEYQMTAYHEAAHAIRAWKTHRLAFNFVTMVCREDGKPTADVDPKWVQPGQWAEIALAGMLSEAKANAMSDFGPETVLDDQPDLADRIADLLKGGEFDPDDSSPAADLPIRVRTVEGPREVAGKVTREDLARIPAGERDSEHLWCAIRSLCDFLNDGYNWFAVESVVLKLLSNPEEYLRSFRLWLSIRERQR